MAYPSVTTSSPALHTCFLISDIRQESACNEFSINGIRMRRGIQSTRGRRLRSGRFDLWDGVCSLDFLIPRYAERGSSASEPGHGLQARRSEREFRFPRAISSSSTTWSVESVQIPVRGRAALSWSSRKELGRLGSWFRWTSEHPLLHSGSRI